MEFGFDFDSFVVFDEVFKNIWDTEAEKAIVSGFLESDNGCSADESILSSTCSNRKHTRGERFDSFSSSEDVQPFKVMRAEAAMIPIGNTSPELALCHQFHATMLMHQRHEVRKDIVRQYFRYVNFNDMNALTRLMHKYFHDQVVYVYPGIREPIKNKAEYLLLLSLLVNTYPDGLWQVHSVDVDGPKKVVCVFSFKGTTVYSFPLDTVFKQLKSQIKKEQYLQRDDIAVASVELLQDTTLNMHPSVMERFKSQNTPANPLVLNNEEDSWLNRITSSLSGVEKKVLREGVFTYKRQVNFFFDKDDRVVKVVGHNFTI